MSASMHVGRVFSPFQDQTNMIRKFSDYAALGIVLSYATCSMLVASKLMIWLRSIFTSRQECSFRYSVRLTRNISRIQELSLLPPIRSLVTSPSRSRGTSRSRAAGFLGQ